MTIIVSCSAPGNYLAVILYSSALPMGVLFVTGVGEYLAYVVKCPEDTLTRQATIMQSFDL